MKFSEVEEASWSELAPYLDTCLIPYTGLIGKETPSQATASLERLRDFMDLVEIPFKGRIITYPAFQYGLGSELSLLNQVCRNVKESGFKHVILMTADVRLSPENLDGFDLLLSQGVIEEEIGSEGIARAIKEKIEKMWQT